MSKNTQLGNLVNGLFVDSTGNVGVGTSSPANAVVVDKGTATASYLQFTAGTTTGQLATDGFEVGIDASGNGIISQQENLPLMIYTNSAERMRITAAGNVGVGTNSPSAALHINGSALPMVVASTSATELYCEYRYNTSSVVGYIGNGTGITVSGGTATDFGIRAQSNLIFTSGGGTERMRITSAGNVGIGTSSPSARLEVQQSTDNYGYGYSLKNIAGNNWQWVHGGDNNLYVGYNASTRFFVGSSGNVGIGTTSPTVFGGGIEIQRSSQAALRASTTTGTLVGGAEFGYEGSDGGYIQTVQANGRFTFYMGNASVLTMRLTSGGNVLIGTTTDNGYKLNVSGSIYASGGIVSNSSVYGVGGIGSQGNIVIDYGYAFGLNSNTQNSANAWNFYVSSSFSNNIRFFYGGTGVGSGTAKAQIDTSGNYSALSDINKKKDIALSTLGLTEVMQLKPSTFKFKDDEKQEEQIGFIAQEVKDIIPQAYYEDEEGDDKFIGLKQTAFIPVLVKAIQELKAEIDILKNK